MAGTLKSKKEVAPSVPAVPVSSMAVKQEPILRQVFSEGVRVAGLAGVGSSGKTNSIMYLLKNFHDLCPSVQIYTYGLTERTQEWATKNLKAIEVSCISHLSDKTNSIFFLDEVHLLGLSDRAKVSEVKAFASFLNHSNNYVVLSTSNIKEYNSTLCSIIGVWLLKTVKLNMTTNGTDLKRSIRDYRGRYKRLDDVILPVNKLLVLSDQRELVIDMEYIPEIDGKAELPDLFAC
ncbi:MAG: hypothetical protein WC055_00010 [Melioribacteraceae bacterium]